MIHVSVKYRAYSCVQGEVRGSLEKVFDIKSASIVSYANTDYSVR